MIAYARKTNMGNYKDVLILDTPPKKESLTKVITDTVKIYPWTEIVNLSTTIPEDADYTPNARKSITRKLKGKPIIKPIYDFLLKLYLKKEQNKEAKTITNRLSQLGEVTQLNMLTQTGVNDTLRKLYPQAELNYFEHGQGDYFFIQNIKPACFNFYCVFADRFKQYLQSHQQDNIYVKNLFDATDFCALAKEVIETDAQKEQIKKQLHIQGKLVLILMENVQIYNVSDVFWTDYLALCIAQIDKPDDYTFILKPHPAQSQKSIAISKEYMLTTRNLQTLIIENKHAVNYSVEVLYSLWRDNTVYVFSVFSSALYYISKLYGNKKTTYYYAYDFFKKYISDAPPQFIEIYKGIEDVVKNVLTENCLNISDKGIQN